jgi:predicted Zn finger-like uncharacterized protein
MRVVCPSCEAAYDVPETVLTARPMLRCARCASDFRPPDLLQAPAPAPAAMAHETDVLVSQPPAPVDSPEPVAPPSPPPPPPPALAPQPKIVPPAGRKRVLAAWAGSVVVIFAVLWLGISHRGAVMRAWPPSVRLYALFGAYPK